MQITDHPLSAQRDPAEFVGLASPLPEIVTWADMSAERPLPPTEVVAGLLHRGSKLVIGGTSKSNKSWCLLGLSVSIAAGIPFWGRATHEGKVLFINFELHPWAAHHRIDAIVNQMASMHLCVDTVAENLHIWNLRGHNADLTTLRPKLEEKISGEDYVLKVIDPAYKVLGNRDENANGEIADLMNEFERLAKKSGAAVALAHHFAKGDSTSKSAIDRMSGAGAWARDPDSIMVLTPHEEAECFTVSCILRNHAPTEEFVVRWHYPLMEEAPELNPAALKTPQSKNKKCTDQEFLDACFPDKSPVAKSLVVTMAKDKFGMEKSSVYNRFNALFDANLLRESGKMLVRI